MNSRKVATAMLASGLFIGLAGCSLMPNRGSVQPTSTYRIDPQESAVEPLTLPAVCPDLRVVTPTAAPGFGGTAMRYSTAPFQIADFAYHRWTAPPAAMLGPVLVERLRADGLFGHVLDAGSGGDAPLQLETRLIDLTQVFVGQQSHIRLTVGSTLIDTANNRTLATRRFAIEVASAPNPVAGVGATNQAIEQWLDKESAWLRQLSRSGLCSGIHGLQPTREP
ncbi:ABC-type transport auxiliary lipoprotein family protein [Acidihalobacter prosperus]|uniref:ABC-type transport auxiliary lipoprotein component domain-containing protein n=1 Tax=Acidihalobacter prosperus TaxID=160660 RepID=A0A1A6C2X1_9GAMM|nr:ABC-type transport auxiliary lipoprotein family protein [Acidihalobacter prosperus]OBS08895.1 hypothetical protein Thpro_023145 [Acidihalobacter prosperus]